jgi:hypothetical protein
MESKRLWRLPLASRTVLIHRILIDNAEKLFQAETRASLIQEIRSLRAKVQKADKKLRPFIQAFGRTLDASTITNMKPKQRQRLREPDAQTRQSTGRCAMRLRSACYFERSDRQLLSKRRSAQGTEHSLIPTSSPPNCCH